MGLTEIVVMVYVGIGVGIFLWENHFRFKEAIGLIYFWPVVLGYRKMKPFLRDFRGQMRELGGF